MSIAVSQIQPLVAAQGVQGSVAFQPGSVIAARVLSVSPDNQVRISIGGQSIDVQTQVPLQAGQSLQLAVSQTSDGIRLAVVTPQAASTSPDSGASISGSGASFEAATLVPQALTGSSSTAAAAVAHLSTTEALAVTTAAQTAAAQQSGLSTLFANLDSAASLQGLPPQLQQAIAQVLAQQPNLDTGLTGDDIKAAFQNSGLFLEANLAAGQAAPSASVPDMKAALIVLRQVLSIALQDATQSPGAPVAIAEQGAQASTRTALQAQTATQTSTQAVVQTPLQTSAQTSTQTPNMTLAQIVAGTPAAPSLVPDVAIEGESIAHAQPATPPSTATSAQQQQPTSAAAAASPQTAAQTSATPSPAATTAALNFLQEALQSGALSLGPLIDDQMLHDLLPGAKPLTTRSGAVASDTPPPPPLRGALPSAQAVALPTLGAETSLPGVMKHLLGNTDAALARQTLMQIASLPDGADAAPTRIDPAIARWNFEIPFMTPQGTAVAQFEISKDGGNDSEASAAQRVWRAKFSLNVEPAGPVHAQISLTGDKTSVRMWAERTATASQLRAGMSQLSQALTEAELKPGDIIIREGAPAQLAPASAGHFLDRAS